MHSPAFHGPSWEQSRNCWKAQGTLCRGSCFEKKWLDWSAGRWLAGGLPVGVFLCLRSCSKVTHLSSNTVLLQSCSCPGAGQSWSRQRVVSHSGWEASRARRRDQCRLWAPKSAQRADTGISLGRCAELCDTTSDGTQLSLQQAGTTDHSEGPQVTNVGSENSREASLQSNSGKTPQIKNIIGVSKISEKNRAPLEGRDYQRK